MQRRDNVAEFFSQEMFNMFAISAAEIAAASSVGDFYVRVRAGYELTRGGIGD